MKTRFFTLISASLITGVFLASAQAHDLGFAGLLDKNNKQELEEVELSVGKPLADEPWVLKSGTAYEVEITSDGSGELALEGANFFRAVWINEVVINDLEVRPFGLESLEFDDKGTMEIEFIAIKPGSYTLKIPGSKGDGQKIDITIQ